MASRETQGYLIAVIILTLLFLVMSLVAYLMFARSNEFSDQVADTKASLSQEQNLAKAYKAEVGILKHYIGVEGAPAIGEVPGLKNQVQSLGDASAKNDLQAISNTYDADMERFISQKEKEYAKSYRGLAENLSSVLGSRTNQISELVSQVQEVERQKETEVKSIQERLTKVTGEKAALQTEFDDAKSNWAQQEQDLKNSLANNKTELESAERKAEQKGAEVIKITDLLTGEKNKLVKDNRQLKQQIEKLTSIDNSLPDGKVIKLGKAGQYVYINLGTGDGLKIKQNFSVFDRDETNFETATPKAKIEVIRIEGPHIAVAKIIDSTAGKPIISRDHILSPTWDPGYQVPIAIAGMIDLDGDGKSDRLRFEALVRRNNGRIVAIHDEEGNRRGEIDSGTRFLIVGETSGQDAKVLEAFTYYDRQAKEFSVQKMTIRRFLNLMGVKMQANVEKLDKSIGKPSWQKRNPTKSAYGDK